ncbi:MAG TPA: Mov34/MPN/PAD-1 family protein, partial [Nitrosomonas sp.]|nr:Mov34/MPN/PAD-1 family protein [Nitrosomonas sp.]
KIKDAQDQATRREICGVLLGKLQGNIFKVHDIALVKNTSYNDHWFKMDPQEYYNALSQTTAIDPNAPYDFLGIIHSHPEFPGYPSTTDWEEAVKGNIPVGLYLIYSTTSVYEDLYTYQWDADLYCYEWDGETFKVLQINYEKH